MYKTKKLLKWIDETVIRYCLYLKVDKPEVVYSLSAFVRCVHPYHPKLSKKQIISDVKHEWGIGKTDTYGSMSCRGNIMALDIKNHSDIEWLKDTIAHELVHSKFPDMGHTKKFYKLIEEILKKG